MGNYENLKQSITEVIRTNGNQEITGAVLQSTLLTIISTVGANATFAGIATPTTNPGTPDGSVFYLASESGTYSNFGGAELQDGLSVLMWNGSWSSQKIFGVDDVPTAGSDNLVKSGGVFDSQTLLKTVNNLLAPYQSGAFVKIENSDDLTRGKYKISIFANGWTTTISGASNTIVSAYSKEIAGGFLYDGWYMIFYDRVNSEFYKVRYTSLTQNSIRHSSDIFIMAVDCVGGGDISHFTYVNSPIVDYLGKLYYTFNSHIDNWLSEEGLRQCGLCFTNTLLMLYTNTSFVKIENSDDLTKGKYKISIFNNAWFVTLNGSRNTTASFYSKDFSRFEGWFQIFYDVKQNEFYAVSYIGFKNSDIRNPTDLFICSADYQFGDIDRFTYVNAPVVNYLGDDYYTFNSDFSHWVKVNDVNNAVNLDSIVTQDSKRGIQSGGVFLELLNYKGINTLLSPYSSTPFVRIEKSDDATRGKYKITLYNNAWATTVKGSRNTSVSCYSKDFSEVSPYWIHIFYDFDNSEFYYATYTQFTQSSIRHNNDLFVCSVDYQFGDIDRFTYVNAPVVNYLGDDYYTFNSDFSHWVKVSDIVTPDKRQSDMYIFQIGDSITWQKDNKLNDDPVTNPNTYRGNGFMRYVCEQMNIPASHHFPRGFSGISVCGYANYLNSNPDAFPKSTTNMSNVIWVVELGTNDWGASFNEPLGTKADYLNKTGNSTMYGALRTLVDYMVEDIDNENVVNKRPQVVMLTPMDRGAYSNSTEESWRPCSFQYDENGDLKFTPNNTGATINDYADAIRWVCEREGFVCVDFIKNPICPRKYMNLALTFESCVMKPTDDKKPEVYQDIYNDNLHPTDKGDIIMGRLIYQKIMQFFYDSNI